MAGNGEPRPQLQEDVEATRSAGGDFDLSRVEAQLEVSDSAVQRWEEQGRIRGIPLPQGLRRSIRPDGTRGITYEPWPREVVKRLVEGGSES